MQFGPVIPPADVAIGAAESDRRPEPPAAIVQHLTGDIDGVVAEIRAILRLAGNAPIRAALNVAFEPLTGETVFCPKVYRTAQGFRPNTGLFVHRSALSITLVGIKSQFTVSPNASLSLIPFM